MFPVFRFCFFINNELLLYRQQLYKKDTRAAIMLPAQVNGGAGMQVIRSDRVYCGIYNSTVDTCLVDFVTQVHQLESYSLVNAAA